MRLVRVVYPFVIYSFEKLECRSVFFISVLLSSLLQIPAVVWGLPCVNAESVKYSGLKGSKD